MVQGKIEFPPDFLQDLGEIKRGLGRRRHTHCQGRIEVMMGVDEPRKSKFSSTVQDFLKLTFRLGCPNTYKFVPINHNKGIFQKRRFRAGTEQIQTFDQFHSINFIYGQ